MSDQTRDELRAWVQELLSDQRITPSGLAKKAGLATTTLTEFMHNDNAPILSSRSIAKIAHAAKVTPIVPGGQPNFGHEESLATDDAVPYHAQENAPPGFVAAVEALIQSRKSADAWVLRSEVLELAGYLPGDILIVDLAAVPVAGLVVCAQAYQWARGRAGTVFRIFEPPYLVTASRDPAARKPLIVDNNQVTIKGVIVASLRLP